MLFIISNLSSVFRVPLTVEISKCGKKSLFQATDELISQKYFGQSGNLFSFCSGDVAFLLLRAASPFYFFLPALLPFLTQLFFSRFNRLFPMADINLFCLVDGESTAFSVKNIPSSDTIDDLKELIKIKKSPEFNDIAADRLSLWRVTIPIANIDKAQLHSTVWKRKRTSSPSDKSLDVFPTRQTRRQCTSWCNARRQVRFQLSAD